MNFRLDLKNLQRIPFEKYNHKFTFVVDGKEYVTSRIVADLLSPIICQTHFQDESITGFNITLNKSITKGNSLEVDYFNEFLNLSQLLENHELDEERINIFSEFFLQLGNINEFIKMKSQYLESQSVIQSIKFLQFLLSNEENAIYGDKIEIIEKIASRFSEISPEDLENLDISTIEEILSSNCLEINDEDSLVKTIVSLIKSGHEYYSLFEYVYFNNVSQGTLEELVEEFDIDFLTRGTWESMMSLFLSHHRQVTPSKRYKVRYDEKEFNYKKGREFEGIMCYLKRETGGNVHDNGTIEIKSSSIWSANFHPKNLVDYNKNNYYWSKNEQDAFILFDFKDREIQLKNYSIKSTSNPPNAAHIRNWKLEVSQDGELWTKVDEHNNDRTLRSQNAISTFNTKPTELFYRFIKLTQTGLSWYNNNCSLIECIEFYGKMRSKIQAHK